MEEKENKNTGTKLLSEITLHSKKERKSRWKVYINSFTGSMLILLVLSTALVENYAAKLEVADKQEQRLVDNNKPKSFLEELLAPPSDSPHE